MKQYSWLSWGECVYNKASSVIGGEWILPSAFVSFLFEHPITRKVGSAGTSSMKFLLHVCVFAQEGVYMLAYFLKTMCISALCLSLMFAASKR